MPKKAVYSLTPSGEERFEKLMFEIAEKPVQMFLDFNAVIVNLDYLSPNHRNGGFTATVHADTGH